MHERFEAFAISIVELNRYLQKIKDSEMKKLGLRANHTMCLYYLGRHGEGLTASQLTDYCKEDKSAISRSLSQLIEKGLVTCEIPQDKRSYRTLHYLTEKGHDVVDQLNQRIQSALFNGGSGLTDEQRSSFYASIEIILKNLIQYLDKCEGKL